MLVGICGAIGSGKDTAASALIERLGFVPVSLAYPLKAACAWIFGEEHHASFFGSQEDKAAEIPGLRGPRGEPLSGRRILQHVGTEGFRYICPDVWVRHALRESERLLGSGASGVVIPDVRFRNEFDAIRKAGGVVWRTVRVGGPNFGAAHHASESEFESFPVDANLVARHGDPDALRRQAVHLAEIGGSWTEGL